MAVIYDGNCGTCGAPCGLTPTGGPQGLLDTTAISTTALNKQYCSAGCLEVARGATGPPDRTRGAVNDGMPFVTGHKSRKKVA
jgi:hypothetical protein